MPTRNLVPGSVYAVLGAIMVGLAGIFNFRNRGASEGPSTPLGTGEEARP